MQKHAIHTLFSLFLVTVATGQAQTICSNATLKGYYGLQISGTRPAATILSGIQATPGTTETVAGVVIQNFDGAGNFTQTDNVKGSLSGITADRTSTGNYQVSPDCTGTFTVLNAGAPPLVNRMVITDNGLGFLTTVVSPQAVMVTATGRKMTYSPSCPVTSAPVLTAATDADGGSTFTTAGTLIAWGQGFTQSGGNSLVFQRAGSSDVVLSETGGNYFWDYSTSQMNASLRALTPGTWSLTAHSACSTAPSNTLSILVK